MAEGSSNGEFAPPTAENPSVVLPDPGLYLCPHCGQAVPAPEVIASPFITCPHCHQEFALPSSEEPEPAAATTDAETEAHMDAMRVHELARARRASIRARSWLIVGAVGCIAIAGELTWKSVVAARALHAISLRTVIFIVITACALGMAVFLGRRALAITRELAKPLLDEPETPPDFSTLSDGSQHWKNLDQM